MLLGNLPFFKNLLPVQAHVTSPKILGEHIPLAKLEVIQLFHISPVKNRDSILTYGLIPKSKAHGPVISYSPRIFVSVTYEEAAFDYVNYEQVDVWTFYLPKHFLFPDEFSSFSNHYYTDLSIPWYKLTLLQTIE